MKVYISTYSLDQFAPVLEWNSEPCSPLKVVLSGNVDTITILQQLVRKHLNRIQYTCQHILVSSLVQVRS